MPLATFYKRENRDYETYQQLAKWQTRMQTEIRLMSKSMSFTLHYITAHHQLLTFVWLRKQHGKMK